MLKQNVQNAVAEALGTADFTLLYPRDKAFGDFAINIHQLKNLQLSDDDIVTKVKKIDLFENVELIASFINIRVSPRAYFEELNAILANDMIQPLQNSASQRISLEFGQPNTHKLPHIGHLFSYTYGEAMARILAFNGHTIFRCNYQGDVGLHVAKCLYIYQQKKGTIHNKTRSSFLQLCYQEGSSAYENDPAAKEAIDALNKAIYQRDPAVLEDWEETRSWSIEYYKEFEKRIGTTYDRYYFESETSQKGVELVKNNVGAIFEESEGATIFRGEKHGLHTRVFLTKNGTPTYEAKDIGLISMKREEWPFDKAIVTTASEQNAYWQVVKKAIELIFPELEGKVMHFGFGMIDLKGGKMSSRTGNIVSAVELVDIVKEKILKDLLKNNDEKVAEVIAVGAVKYAFLKSEAKKNMLFDMEQSVSVQGNSGPYLQYTYARLRSVLAKADYKAKAQPVEMIAHSAEDDAVLRILPTFYDVVRQAGETYAPHLICTYVYDVAQACNVLYDKQSILKASPDEKEMRLALLEAASRTIKASLHLLGIDVLERI